MDLGNAAQIASSLVAILALIISLVSSRSKGFTDAIAAVRNENKNAFEQWSIGHRAEAADIFDRLRRVEADVSAMKNEIAHMPDKDTAHRLEMAIEGLKGQIGIMDQKLIPVASMATRLQEFVLEKVQS